MNSKERILNTFTRKPCDRIPVSASYLVKQYEEFFANQEHSYDGLMQFIAENTDSLYPCWFDIATTAEAQDRRKTNIRQEGNLQIIETVMHAPAGDLSSCQKIDAGVATSWTTEHLLKDSRGIDIYLSIPDEIESVGAQTINTAIKRLENRYGIPWVQLGDPAGMAASLFEFGEFLILCLTEPDKMRHLMDAIFERMMRHITLGLQALEPKCETCLFTISGPEYLTPPYLPEKYLKEFVLPYITPMIELIHKYDHYVSVHCHGRSADALKYFVEAGADAADPIEPPPDGDITLIEAKRRYGRDLVLMGNVEISLLDIGDTATVVEYVKDMVTVGKQDGRYIAMPTSFPIDIPLRKKTEHNWIAYIEMALEHGRY